MRRLLFVIGMLIAVPAIADSVWTLKQLLARFEVPANAADDRG